MGNGQSWQATRIFERRSPFRSDGNVAALSFYGATFTSPDGNIGLENQRLCAGAHQGHLRRERPAFRHHL
jgi:hypothetical protein